MCFLSQSPPIRQMGKISIGAQIAVVLGYTILAPLAAPVGVRKCRPGAASAAEPRDAASDGNAGAPDLTRLLRRTTRQTYGAN